MVTDYYAMLGVDPGSDPAAIEAALARNQPAWSSGTRNPKNKHTYQSYLDQIPALRRTLLGDPSVRAAYDAELAAARRVERDRKLDRLLQLTHLRAAKGGLAASDRALLRDEAVKLGLAADDLDRLAGSFPERPEGDGGGDEPDDGPDPAVDALDPTTRRQIRVALEHLRRGDLYDALGLSHDAPAAEIAARADEERRRWMQKTQVTAEKTAWLEVVSLAQSHLGTPSARGRYDRTLGLEREEALGGSIAFVLQGMSRLDPGTRSALVDEAAALGIPPDRADRLIRRACRALDVACDPGPAAAVMVAGPGAGRLLRCRACDGLTDHGQAARAGEGAECRHCRASLRWDCPICRRRYWVDESRCSCGFRVEDREPLVRHFEAAQHAFRARDYGTALAELGRVREIAPRHVGARKGIEKLRQRLDEIGRARAGYETAMAAARAVAARAAVSAWGRLVGPSDPELEAARGALGRVLREAEALAARARALEISDPPAARALYRRALALATDWPEARAGILRCPPDPPSTLVAEFANDRVRLRWTPPAPDDLGPVSYLVSRKPGGLPAHPGDGVRIAEVAEPAFEDAGVALGETVSYAVQSRRHGVDSVAAVAVGPVALLGEVRDVRVAVRSRAVDLSWTLPAAARDVRVVRKLGAAPAGPKDGERIETLREEAHDAGLEDDRVYHYAIYAVYRMADGTLVPSRGVHVSARPQPPVSPPAAPRLSQEPDGRVRLAWDEPARGTVRILRTARPPAASPGDRLGVAEVEALEGQPLEPTAPDQAVDLAPPPSGVCYYTPMILQGGTYTVGHPALFSCIPDPSELRATRVGHGDRVHLRWRWVPQAGLALVVARVGASPDGPHDPEARVESVTEGLYGRQGRFTLTLPAGAGGGNDAGPWHIRVFSVAVVDGEPVVSPGLDPSAAVVVPGPHPEVTVSYSFRRSGFPTRGWSVAFRTEPPGAPIPPTALVTHPRTVPLAIDDGTIAAEFPAARDGATFPIDPSIDLSRRRARVFADPRTDPEGLTPIRLRHPEAGVTRV